MLFSVLCIKPWQYEGVRSHCYWQSQGTQAETQSLIDIVVQCTMRLLVRSTVNILVRWALLHNNYSSWHKSWTCRAAVAVIVEEAVQGVRKHAKHPFLCFPTVSMNHMRLQTNASRDFEWLRSMSLWALTEPTIWVIMPQNKKSCYSFRSL